MKHKSGKQMAAIARENGWVFVSQKGSHAKFRNPITGKMAIIPIHGNQLLCTGTQRTIMRNLDITDADL